MSRRPRKFCLSASSWKLHVPIAAVNRPSDRASLELPEQFKHLERTDIGELLRQWGSLSGSDPTQVSPEDRVLAEREEGTLV